MKLKTLIIICLVLVVIVAGSLYAYNIIINRESLPQIIPEQETAPEVAQTPKAAISSNQHGLPKPPYYLVISGEINKDYTKVDLKPFFFATKNSKPLTNGKSVPGSEFKILLKKKGTTFYQSNLDATNCMVFDIDYCAKFDHSYGSFLQALDGFSQLPDEIVFQHSGKDIYSIKEPSDPFPEFTLISQEYKNGVIKISWNVKDENKKLHYFAYVSNNNFIIDGSGGTMSVLEYSLNDDGSKILNGNSFTLFPKGHIDGNLQVAIYATDGFRTRAIYSDKFTTEKAAVEAKIRFPENGKTYGQNYVPLEAISFNPDNGLSCEGCESEGNTFAWTSSLDGLISSSYRSTCQYLTPGDHKITLQVKNKNGTQASTSVNIKVNFIGDYSDTETKARQAKGQTCY